jgi:AbrB family looped-hinge helix DNA binding protein
MAKDLMAKQGSCAQAKDGGEGAPCCKIEALVPIDARGQIVLPKELRDKAGIEAGDKLAVIAFESGGKVCCMALVKADDFADTIRGALGPLMADILPG